MRRGCNANSVRFHVGQAVFGGPCLRSKASEGVCALAPAINQRIASQAARAQRDYLRSSCKTTAQNLPHAENEQGKGSSVARLSALKRQRRSGAARECVNARNKRAAANLLKNSIMLPAFVSSRARERAGQARCWKWQSVLKVEDREGFISLPERERPRFNGNSQTASAMGVDSFVQQIRSDQKLKGKDVQIPMGGCSNWVFAARL